MNSEISHNSSAESGHEKSRPVLLSVLCFFSFVFFALLTILFFTGIFYSGWITSVTNHYLPNESLSNSQCLVIFITGFLLHLLGFIGSILIWNLHKLGYYFLGCSCLVIAAFMIFQPLITISTVTVYIVLLLLFGLFFKRLH